LAIEADQGDPLAVVVLLPDEVAVELAGNSYRREIVVQAEVEFVVCAASCAQGEETVNTCRLWC